MKTQIFLALLTFAGFIGSSLTGYVREIRFVYKIETLQKENQSLKKEIEKESTHIPASQLGTIHDSIQTHDTVFIPVKQKSETKDFKKISDSVFLIKPLGLDKEKNNYMFLIGHANKDSSLLKSDTLKEKVNIKPSPIKIKNAKPDSTNRR